MRGRALCQQKQGEGYRARLHHQRWRCSGAPPDLLPTTIWPPGACAFGFASAHFLFDQCNRCSSLSCSASAAAARLLLVVVLGIVKVLQFTTELVGVKGISPQWGLFKGLEVAMQAQK